MDEKLQDLGAQFMGLLDIAPNDANSTTYTIRTGENDGSVEDIATGSLVGPVGAFLVAHGLEKPDELITVQQGQNLGRNSKLHVKLVTSSDGTMDVIVQGSVCKIARGVLNAGLTL